MFIYNAFIYLPCINTQRQTTAPFDVTHVISSSDRQTPRLYQGSADRCEVYRNSDIIRLLQPSQTIHCFNQTVLVIVPDLNIFVFSIIFFYLVLRSALVQLSSITCEIFVELDGAKVLHIWFVTRIVSSWSPSSRASALYCYYENTVLSSVRYRLVFDNLVCKFISIYAALTHSDEQQHNFLRDRHRHGWV